MKILCETTPHAGDWEQIYELRQMWVTKYLEKEAFIDAMYYYPANSYQLLQADLTLVTKIGELKRIDAKIHLLLFDLPVTAVAEDFVSKGLVWNFESLFRIKESKRANVLLAKIATLTTNLNTALAKNEFLTHSNGTYKVLLASEKAKNKIKTTTE